MITLTALTLCLLTLPCGAPADPPDAPQCIVIQIDTDGNVWDKSVHRQGPKVWIGVRVTPLPEALAAHLKRAGLMIANVAEDSPADRAGVERYDVVVSFAGNAVAGMDDLLEAIRQTGADNTAEIVVIRGGKEQTLTITPAKRGDPGTCSFKYEEPETPEVDLFKKYFGHRFKLGPRGMGLVLPYGRLDRLPEDIEELLEDLPHFDWEEWCTKSPKSKHLPFGMKIEIDTDHPGGWSWFSHDIEDTDAAVEIRIKISEDGETIVIERAKDGSITVEREDADGNRSSATYKNADQLQEEDADAYQTYRRFLVTRSPWAPFVTPDLKSLGAGQHQFQIELRRQLDKAREQVEAAAEQAREARKHVELRLRKIKDADDSDFVARAKTVMIMVDDDGRITLEITEDDVSKKYEFDSREDFENIEPELYEQYRKHLDKSAP